ncbi:uncharacterized protein LOC110695458 [Chenopodium quinoa]|uniref:uncharacterized protein LOC110695458 n=1 Tax=Chenopodium quinoa TaxID=63459 RepID=UPI000B774954|nr:uncharacterized protein LOC110695458 [Chenopodium quinoa]
MSEKEGGVVRRECMMDAFRYAIDVCGLKDLGYKGCKFTWRWGKSEENLIRERLDRFWGDDDWCEMHPNFSVKHLVREESDHAPIMLDTLNYYDRGKGGKLFRFEAMWLSSDSCEAVISKAWGESEGLEEHQRIEQCALGLKKWSATTFKKTQKKIRRLEKELLEAQGGHIDAAMLDCCEKLSNELGELRRLEESYWYARARANEMRDGDKNTTYFHRKASQRKKKNRIDGLFDKDGVWRDEDEKICNIVADYFSNLFSSDNPTEFEAATEGLSSIVTDSMNVVVEEEPTAMEIKKKCLVPNAP